MHRWVVILGTSTSLKFMKCWDRKKRCSSICSIICNVILRCHLACFWVDIDDMSTLEKLWIYQILNYTSEWNAAVETKYKRQVMITNTPGEEKHLNHLSASASVWLWADSQKETKWIQQSVWVYLKYNLFVLLFLTDFVSCVKISLKRHLAVWISLPAKFLYLFLENLS